MSIVGEVLERKDRPAYVRFERVAIEDPVASRAAGHYVAKDVDYALITPPFSKDIFKIKVAQWLVNLKQDVQNDRLPQQWADQYVDAYKRWQNGQEIPLSGTPIKGWGVISPAQQETLIRLNILTVEDMAACNDEGINRIGMGASELRNKAKAWLAQLSDKGPLTVEIAALKSENQVQKGSIAILTRQVEELMGQVRASNMGQAPVAESNDIGASDILDDTEPAVAPVVAVKRGRPPKQPDAAPQEI